MRSLDHQKAISLEIQSKSTDTRDPVLNRSTRYLYDRNDPKNPFNAGMNAGLVFAHSALCKTHHLPQHDLRLDTRQWDLSNLKPCAREDQFGEFAFWYGVDYAMDKMKRLFQLKIERGLWDTGRDAAQIALLQTRDVKRGYGVVPGRRGVPADVHTLYRNTSETWEGMPRL